MTKQNIVNIVSEATGLTKVETEAVMNGVMTTIIESLGRNERVELRGFGTFGVKHRMPKKARNPGTGEAMARPGRHGPDRYPHRPAEGLCRPTTYASGAPQSVGKRPQIHPGRRPSELDHAAPHQPVVAGECV